MASRERRDALRGGLLRWSAVTAVAGAIVMAGCVKSGERRQPAKPAESVALIPREVLFGNPRRLAPDLSPDGTRLAYVAPDEGVLNIWVRTVGRHDDMVITKDRRRGIWDYFWAPNGRQLLYVQDVKGDENYHVYAVPAEGGEAVDLTPIKNVRASIVAVDRQFPDEILIGLNDRVPQLHDVHRLNLKTGKMTLEVQNDLNAAGWVADRALRVRLAQVMTPDGGAMIMYRAAPDATWTKALSWGMEDALTTGVYAFKADNETVYLISSVGANTAQVRTLNLATGKQTLVASDSSFDASDLMLHPTTHEIQAVGFLGERKRWQVIDPSIKGDLDVLARAHPGDFRIGSRDLADTTWLVGYTQDKGGVVYSVYDRASRKATFLFSARPDLERYRLAAMKPVTYVARDGLTIHGYLTLPVGAKPKNLPVVINIHGGPWFRDTWGYNAEAQWLANRGYACLQVNFRGSTGYGKAFVNAGNREWGGKMQDDVADGAQWLIDQGIADPKRVGVYGGSYGGFAVLSGLSKTPDLYACGVDMVGPSNLITFLKTVPPYWEPARALLRERVGDVEKDEAFLKSRSPLFHVDQIRAPLLIAQGANDPRVKRAESVQVRDALTAAGKTVEYLEFADEGHGFARPENRISFYAAAEKFFAAHLGGRFEAEMTEEERKE